MKKVVLTYGLISGLVAGAMLIAMSVTIFRTNNFESGELYGYSGMLLSLIFVFVGIRAYRDQVAGGSIAFGPAFKVGILITLISCCCYVVFWMIIYYNFMPDFLDRYIEYSLNAAREAGANETEVQKKAQEMETYKTLYANPLTLAGVTFLEPFPLGLLVTLISAAILRRKKTGGDPGEKVLGHNIAFPDVKSR